MASTPVLFLLFFMLFAHEATAGTNHSSIIRLGSLLSPRGNQTSWPSSSGHFAFGFYPRGNGYAVGIWLVTKPNNTIVWTANRDSPPVSSNSTLKLTKHGGQILQKGEEHPELLIPDEDEDDRKQVASASMQDSGNFVLYDKDFQVIWSSFDDPTDTILGGQNLTDVKLVSSVSQSDHSSGRFYLSMQTDGNLVAYPVNSSGEQEDAYWAQLSYGSGSGHLSLSTEGSLCLRYDASDPRCLADSNNLRKKSKSTTSIYRATLGEDGNFRLYAHQFEGNTNSGVPVLQWEAMNDKCQVPLCGLNSYCSNMSGKAVCECYPGFVPTNSGGKDSMFLDCKRNHSKDDCESIEDPTVLYYLTSLKDMRWGDSPYFVAQMKMEACKNSCWQDCDCGAVLYTSASGICNKYRLPLMYGRRLQGASTVALLKMPSENVTSSTTNRTVPSQRKPKVLVDDKKSLLMILSFTLGGISIFGLVFVVYIFFTYRRQVHRYATLSASENLGFTEEYSLRSFSFDELVKSTGGFTEEVGRGSFGAVYTGTIGDRRVAVKRLEKIADEGEREFQAEITSIARTHHKNLVKLIGFCIDGSKKLLVYEYVSNGSLANLLFKSHMPLPWKERLKIALDVARGVLYLHEECEVRIIHCNIKPQNILMDEAWTAKISDFGFARLLKPDHSRMSTVDDRRSRYLAPEWQKDESVSVKADVYSFGVVLLEIACRRSNIDINVPSPEEILLSSWVYQCFAAGQLNKLVADDEGKDVDWRILERMVKVGLWCVQDKPSLRPSMKNVILMLEGLKDIPVPPSPALLVI